MLCLSCFHISLHENKCVQLCKAVYDLSYFFYLFCSSHDPDTTRMCFCKHSDRLFTDICRFTHKADTPRVIGHSTSGPTCRQLQTCRQSSGHNELVESRGMQELARGRVHLVPEQVSVQLLELTRRIRPAADDAHIAVDLKHRAEHRAVL